VRLTREHSDPRTTVRGEAITEYDIEQRTKLNFLSTHKQAARQDVID
jgi:peptidyl-prolyl cis-trans isomerase SurA